MIYKLLFLLFCIVTSIEAKLPTSLRHNQLEFANGGGFSDSISEDLPLDIIPSTITYEDYLSYVYGFSIYDLGTVNVLGGSSKNVLFGQWVGDVVTTTENVYSGIEGFSPEGKMGTISPVESGAANQNAYSDLQIAESENGNSIWFRSDTNNKNQLDSYETIDATFTPTNPLSLAFQAEAGDVLIKNMFAVESGVTSGKVGIGTTLPQDHLHINGNVKATGLFGEIGKIITLPYQDLLNITLNNSQGANSTLYNDVYKETFDTTGWPSNMDAMVFVSFFAQPVTWQSNLMQYILIVYDDDPSLPTQQSELNAVSGAAIFDAESGANYRDFTLFISLSVVPDRTYTVQVLGISDGGSNGDGSKRPNVNIHHLSGFVYALPSE